MEQRVKINKALSYLRNILDAVVLPWSHSTLAVEIGHLNKTHRAKTRVVQSKFYKFHNIIRMGTVLSGSESDGLQWIIDFGVQDSLF